MTAATMLPMLGCGNVFAAGKYQRIVSLDYGLASTLLSLGVTPAAIAALADWDTWVVEPAMPETVADLGSAWEVNFELLADLKPDLILTTPYLEELKPRLETIAPVLSIPVYDANGGSVLPKAYRATTLLGKTIGLETEASTFLAHADRVFEACRKRLERIAPSPVLLINFMDARHARIYAAPGLYQGVLDRIGLENAWKGAGDYWGFQTIGIEELAAVTAPDARLIAFEPLPRGVMPKIENSPLWQVLPFTRPGRFSVLPGVLMFGMVREALRFATILTDHLEATA
jgi:ABC-type Fe3+-hydroxamate transport system substrate-binding protein